MKRRDIVIGVMMIAIVGGLFYFRNKNSDSQLKVPEGKTASVNIEKDIEDKFNVDIPDSVDKAELKDVSGGDGSGIATRDSENGKEINVLADLKDPESGKYYNAFIIKGEEGSEGYDQLSLGRLRIAKGGWIIEYRSIKDLSDYSKVIITLRDNSHDKGKVILEGNF